MQRVRPCFFESRPLMLIMISGYAGNGKDECGKFFVSQGFKRLAFADLLKSDVANFHGISSEQLEQRKEEFRPDLIRYAEQKRKENPLYWVNLALTPQIKDEIRQGNNYVITDWRFEPEYTALNDIAPRLLTCRVQRGSGASVGGGKGFSETSLDNFDFDHVIKNDGEICDLYEKLRFWYGLVLSNNI